MALCTWKAAAQQTGVRTNALYWLTSTPNLGVDIRIGHRSTIALQGGYNPFLFPSYKKGSKDVNPKLLHWFVLPEYRYWFCRTYERWFLSAYGIYGKYNIEGVPFLGKREERYRGMAAGGGIGAGYQWPLGKHCGIELMIGIGYLYLKYDKFAGGTCGMRKESAERHWIGPNRIAVSFSYYIR